MGPPHPVVHHLTRIDQILKKISTATCLSKHQIVLLSTFPILIVIGQFMNRFSPEETIHNYFTSRGNLVNTYFVKFGWFWTIFSYSVIIFTKIRKSGINRRLMILSITKVTIITIGWILFTQWCFGPPLMDRIFIITGGQCDNVLESKIPEKLKKYFSPSSDALQSDYYFSKYISSSRCKSFQGSWKGGHDPSGHIFLLTLGITVLVIESIELYTNDENVLNEIWNSDFNLYKYLSHPSSFVLLVISLDFMMFLMTILKYHSLAEQMAGLIVALMVIWGADRIIEVLVDYV